MQSIDDLLKQQDKLLRECRTNHMQQTKHFDVRVGGNFCECMVCHKHVHVTGTMVLILHGRTKLDEYRIITPTDF